MGTKFFNVKPNGINTHPTSVLGGETAALKATGYAGRSAGNAAGKDLAAAKALRPLTPVMKSAATAAPGPKKV